MQANAECPPARSGNRRTIAHRARAKAFILSALGAVIAGACRQDGARHEGGEAAAKSVVVERLRPYPPGRWRLDPSRLSETVLWVSHIVVRHRGSSLEPCFTVADWHSSLPPSQRTREEALTLAQQIADKAQRAPEAFSQLAREYSEDIATRDGGGSLGGLPASQLEPWPSVLDALAATPIGHTSTVVETRYGFHIFQRRAPVPEQIVTGVHLVVAHDDAEWIKVLARGAVPRRRRGDAQALANELYERARQHEAEFAQLIEQHSEHRDAVRGGDMGTWSTREPTDYPREVETLSRLAVGEIAPPIDSLVGFQIIMRVENRPRASYAMEQVRLGFDPSVATGSQSSGAVVERAKALAAEIHRAPGRFAELQRELCCVTQEQWIDGRGSPAVSAALDRVKVGQLIEEPVRSEYAYVIARRVEPERRISHPPLYELAKPAAPNILHRISLMDEEMVEAEFRAIAAEARAALQLTGQKESEFSRLHQLQAAFANDVSLPEKRTRFEALLAQLRQLLGAEGYARYEAIMNAHFEDQMLAGR